MWEQGFARLREDSGNSKLLTKIIGQGPGGTFLRMPTHIPPTLILAMSRVRTDPHQVCHACHNMAFE